jgi:hypothetical protein
MVSHIPKATRASDMRCDTVQHGACTREDPRRMELDITHDRV